MKKFGMGALIALAIAGVSVATLSTGCEKKPEPAKKAPEKPAEKPADGAGGGH
ncbi:MAG: hypothetical protein AB7G11_04470 [Phycisphaerales bacterium]